MRCAGHCCAVGAVLLTLVSFTAESRADWQPIWQLMNNGIPVDTGQPVALQDMPAYRPMPTVSTHRRRWRAGRPRIPLSHGPEHGGWADKWRISDTGAGVADSGGGAGSWSDLATSDKIPVFLNNAVWYDKQMILARDPLDPPGTFFGTVSSHLLFGGANTDEHSDTYALRFDGSGCLRWNGGSQYCELVATTANPNTLWGQWHTDWGCTCSGFDYDPYSHTGLLVGQWAAGGHAFGGAAAHLPLHARHRRTRGAGHMGVVEWVRLAQPSHFARIFEPPTGAAGTCVRFSSRFGV